MPLKVINWLLIDKPFANRLIVELVEPFDTDSLMPLTVCESAEIPPSAFVMRLVSDVDDCCRLEIFPSAEVIRVVRLFDV